MEVPTMPPEWITVEDVATELRVSRRRAWELVKRLAVPCVWTVRGTIDGARFTRADWERCRDASKAPPEPRASSTPSLDPGKLRVVTTLVPKPGIDSWRRDRPKP